MRPMQFLPLYNVFLPITFEFSDHEDDFDLCVTVCVEIGPVQYKLKGSKRGEKQQEREYWQTARLQRYSEPSTVYIAISLAIR